MCKSLTIAESKAVKYAEECCSPDNKKVPKYVKLQCRKWLDIVEGKNPDAYISEKAFKKICKLLKLIIHPDTHKSMYKSMEPYTWLIVTAVFCTKCTEGNYRYYQTVLLEIARKNFKTFTSAIIFILAMLTEPPFSKFYSVAPDLKLSKELQNAIRKIIKSSPLLLECDAFKLLRSEIRCLITDNDYIPLAYSQDKMDGKLAAIFLADEAGAMDNYPIEAMRSSQITLKNKLGIIISTQYPKDDNALLKEIDFAKRCLDGLQNNEGFTDDRYFALLYEPDDDLKTGDHWKSNDLVIYQSNPVAVDYPHIFEDIKKKRTMAILYESNRENYLCKHNNIQYKSLGVEGFIDVTKVKLCKRKEEAEWWRGRRVWLGLDLSLTEDNTAVAMVTEEDGIVYAKVWGFIPTDRIEEKSQKEDVNYRRLIKDGVCYACGDEVIGYGFVEEFILSLPEKYGVEIMELGFDRYNAISTVQKLESAEDPIECVEIKQHSSLLHRPTKWLKEIILSKQFVYDENLLLEINFQNARCTEDTNLNKYVNKKKSSGKVDCVVALINALYLLQLEVENGSGWGAIEI